MLHTQSPPPDWPHALSRLPVGTYNKFFSPHLCQEANLFRPDCFATFRHHVDHQSQYFNAADKHAAARNYIELWFNPDFIERAHAVAGVEGLNETYAPNDQKNPAAFDVAFAQVWTDEFRNKHPECRHVRPILGNIAVGNDAPISVAKAAHELDGIMGYHAYWPVRNGIMALDQTHYAMRWQRLDALYKAAGYFVDWLFTESGAIGFNNPDNTDDWGLDGRAGWKHSSVYGGDQTADLNGWRWFVTECRKWNQANGNRALGANAFTSHVHDDGTWEYFLLDQPYLNDMADMMAELSGFTVKQPDPEPEPEPDPTRYRKLIRLLPQQSSWQLAQKTLAIANKPDNQNTISYSPHDTANILTLPDSADGSSVVLHGEHSADMVLWFQKEFRERAPETDLHVRYHTDWKLPPHGRAGVDVSRWNDPRKFDAEAAKKAGITFLIIRASYGITTDPNWYEWLDVANTHGFDKSAFHWISPSRQGDAQARHFAWLCHSADLNYYPSFDVEEGPSGKPTPAQVEHAFYTFTDIAAPPICYTGHGQWKNVMGNKGKWAADFYLWLAAHTTANEPIVPEPWSDWVMWQHHVGATHWYPERIDQNCTPGGLRLSRAAGIPF